LLAPGVIPRIDLLPLVRPEVLGSAKLTVIYGGRSKDWMDSGFGEEAVRGYTGDGGEASLHFVDAAGHQLILDAPEDFCEVMVGVVKPPSTRKN
jgi:pimeloyl-ACP methyl ester carboxylesterase